MELCRLRGEIERMAKKSAELGKLRGELERLEKKVNELKGQ